MSVVEPFDPGWKIRILIGLTASCLKEPIIAGADLITAILVFLEKKLAFAVLCVAPVAHSQRDPL